jgi:hypothetical protein
MADTDSPSFQEAIRVESFSNSRFISSIFIGFFAINFSKIVIFSHNLLFFEEKEIEAEVLLGGIMP